MDLKKEDMTGKIVLVIKSILVAISCYVLVNALFFLFSWLSYKGNNPAYHFKNGDFQFNGEAVGMTMGSSNAYTFLIIIFVSYFLYRMQKEGNISEVSR